ncbi:MAG TPA: hypothetical protein VLJ68_03775 [Chitinophagaceae bacterium]|nr:hypothetical protein [Chitinophagaceae bacterium]
MKKLSVCTLLLILSATSFCQPTKTNTPLTRDEYLKKSKSQKIVGFVLVGVGTAGLLLMSGGNADLDAVGPIVVVSAVAILGSIPLFIAAGKNKRRAKTAAVSFNFQSTPTLQRNIVSFHRIPGLSLKINL